jgi:hypothetical protein
MKTLRLDFKKQKRAGLTRMDYKFRPFAVRLMSVLLASSGLPWREHDSQDNPAIGKLLLTTVRQALLVYNILN